MSLYADRESHFGFTGEWNECIFRSLAKVWSWFGCLLRLVTNVWDSGWCWCWVEGNEDWEFGFENGSYGEYIPKSYYRLKIEGVSFLQSSRINWRYLPSVPVRFIFRMTSDKRRRQIQHRLTSYLPTEKLFNQGLRTCFRYSSQRDSYVAQSSALGYRYQRCQNTSRLTPSVTEVYMEIPPFIIVGNSWPL